MAEKDYTEDSKKWPKTPGKDWQLELAKNTKKVTKSGDAIWHQGKGGSGVG
jgi:hypothetical protein